MKMRRAYIGLSYPLFYDYRNCAIVCDREIESQPNPILESPMGLLILYDELLFLSESLCPLNMRGLPYVKYVDRLFPDICLSNIRKASDGYAEAMASYEINFQNWELIRKSMGIDSGKFRVDSHSRTFHISDISTSATFSYRGLAFDFGVFSYLKQHYDSEIEFLTNSMMQNLPDKTGNVIEFAEKIVIENIPNYLSVTGPYHECIEELRGHCDLTSFRNWIADEHGYISKSEIAEATEAVSRAIEETKDKLFNQFFDEYSGYSCSKSIGKTILKATASGIPGLNLATTIVGLYDDLSDSAYRMDKMFEAENLRWQKFVVDSRKITKEIEHEFEKK